MSYKDVGLAVRGLKDEDTGKVVPLYITANDGESVLEFDLEGEPGKIKQIVKDRELWANVMSDSFEDFKF